MTSLIILFIPIKYTVNYKLWKIFYGVPGGIRTRDASYPARNDNDYTTGAIVNIIFTRSNPLLSLRQALLLII